MTTTIAVNNGVSLKPTRQFDASSRNWDAPKSEDELFEPLARDAGDVSGLDIQLDKREMCMDCPASANLTRPNGRVGSVSYCCPTKRRTVTVTKPNKTTWIIRTSYVKTTVKATSTVAVRATVEKISGRLYVSLPLPKRLTFHPLTASMSVRPTSTRMAPSM